MGRMKALAIDHLNDTLDHPMDHLGTLTNHHLALTDRELEMVINALAFFHAYYSQSAESFNGASWQDIAADTHLPSVDGLATRLTCIAMERP